MNTSQSVDVKKILHFIRKELKNMATSHDIQEQNRNLFDTLILDYVDFRQNNEESKTPLFFHQYLERINLSRPLRLAIQKAIDEFDL